MILGVYWYFGFPEGLYQYKYFSFQAGTGGMADLPIELKATVTAPDPQALIQQLDQLSDRYPEGHLLIRQENEALQIVTGGYALFDYDFLLIKEVEKVLDQACVKMIPNRPITNEGSIRLDKNRKWETGTPKERMFQLVGSSLKKSNAETLALRLDIRVDTIKKADFIADIDKLLPGANMNVFYYREGLFEHQTNLMLMLTNGRQGLDFTGKQDVDISALQEQVQALFSRYGVDRGFIGGNAAYPTQGPFVRRIVDEAYIL